MATAKKPELGGSCPSCGSAMRACEDCPGPCGVFVCMNANCGDGPKQPVEPPITDESLIARNHALREALRNLAKEHESVVDNCIDPKQHMFAEQQERLHRAARALNVAKAALVEEEGK